MTVKQATKIASTLALGLTNAELPTAIGNQYSEKEIDTIINAYRQRKDDDVDLAGPAPEAKAVKTAPKTKAMKAAKKTAPKTKAAKKVVTKKTGVGARQVALILTGLSNAEVLAKILKEFKGVKTTVACVAWYRAQMRKAPKKYGIAKASLVPASASTK